MVSISNEIMERIKSGDEPAFHELFEKTYPDLCRFSCLYVKDRDIAENIVQDFFVNFWIKRDTLAINTSISSYLFSSVKNRSLNHIRDTKKILKLDENIDLVDSTVSYPDFQDEIDMNNLNNALKEAIESLPPKCRTIFKMSRFEELTYKEIANKLDISAKTVENQIGIALKKLHEVLKKYPGLLIIVFSIIIQYLIDF
jgi:RNA polymerase sigma-70 factor, ECF subfamily